MAPGARARTLSLSSIALVAIALAACQSAAGDGLPGADSADDAGGGGALADANGSGPVRDGDDASVVADARASSDASSVVDARGAVDAAHDASSAKDAALDVASDVARDAAPPPPPPPPPPDGGACNAITNGGPVVPEVRVAADPPTPQGGTLVVGTYVLTRWEIFTGPGGQAGATGNTRQHTMAFGASTYEEAIADNGATPEHFTRTWSTQGTFFSSRQLCPTVEDLGDDYTATPTTLTLSSYGVVFTLTKQ